MANPVSPKVHAAGGSAAAVTIIMYVLDQVVPFVASMPVTAKGAVLVLVTLAVTYVAGWLAKDPLRNLGAKFDHNPSTK